MSQHFNNSITFSLYIVHAMSVKPFFYNKRRLKYIKTGIYPYNVLRNIGIDSISTTHFLLADIDVIPSINLYDSIMRQSAILSDPDNVILFQLFQYSARALSNCRSQKCFLQL